MGRIFPQSRVYSTKQWCQGVSRWLLGTKKVDDGDDGEEGDDVKDERDKDRVDADDDAENDFYNDSFMSFMDLPVAGKMEKQRNYSESQEPWKMFRQMTILDHTGKKKNVFVSMM